MSLNLDKPALFVAITGGIALLTLSWYQANHPETNLIKYTIIAGSALYIFMIIILGQLAQGVVNGDEGG